MGPLELLSVVTRPIAAASLFAFNITVCPAFVGWGHHSGFVIDRGFEL